VDSGRLIASGRDGDIYEHGPGRVLRRAKSGRNLEGEARVMQYAAEHGYPVPEVFELRAGGTELVMERIDGPMMMDAMLKQPWTMPRLASTLADLHDRLHEIPAPDGLRHLPDDGDRLIHLDLHPMNVMMAARGPVVIDWTNAARGKGLTDVAATYVLLTCPEMPGSRALQLAVQPARIALARLFTRRYRGRELQARIAAAADLKALDPNFSPAEVERCRTLAGRMRQRATR
jgi:aminoglycoside phosphotransferase (APT) family kinase protein